MLPSVLMFGASGEVLFTANVWPSACRPATSGSARNAGSACDVAGLRCDARGAAMASGSDMPRASRFIRIWMTVVMILAPPRGPTARNGLPSLSTMVGDMLDRGRLPGAARFGSGASPWVGAKLKSVRSEERRGGKESIYQCDWSSDVCSSDLLEHDGRRHARPRPLARRGEVRVRRVTLGRREVEVGQLVVEHEPAARHDDAAAAELLDGVRVGHDVAPLVGDDEVVRVCALVAVRGGLAARRAGARTVRVAGGHGAPRPV